MWRWPVIERRKTLSNQAKQKLFSLHAKRISIAAQKWWDPDKNPALYDAIEKAKKDNVPNDNIERAIKRWIWEDKDSCSIIDITYEWYWVWWVAFIINALTDNKNRTASDIRHIFSKYGWNMWESWSVSFLFDKKWVIYISLDKYEESFLEEKVFQTEIEDYFVEDNFFKIFTSIEFFQEVKNFFLSHNIEFEYSWINFIPNTMVNIDEFDKALKLLKMIEAFEESEDIENITHNMVIDKKLENEVKEFIEKNKFKT